MANFPDIEANYGASKSAQPNVRVVQFGSGYSQRSTFGINQDQKIWQLESFDWSPPDETDTYKWICKSWTKTMPYSNLFNITATFEEVFEA